MSERNRSKDWLDQAVDDLKFAEASLSLGHYNQTCFICQQAAEKALKAMAFYNGAEYVKTHSVTQLARDLNINGEIEEAGKELDMYYISSRYPDALPGGAPYQVFSLTQAVSCLKKSKLIVERVQYELK